MSVDASPPPDSPAAIDAVPLRHPWRWVAAIVIVVLVGAVPLRRGDQRGLRLGHLRQVPVRRADLCRRAGQHPAADHLLDGPGDRARRDAGGHAAVAEPGVQVGVVGLPVDLPRHPGVRAAGVLGADPDDLPEHPARHPVRADVLHISTCRTCRSTFLLAIIGLALNEAAYMAEIIRAGISSVPGGSARGVDGAGHVVGA